MSLEEKISLKVKANLTPLHFEIDNESHKHAHDSENSHFKLLVVSDKFEGMSRVARQRLVFDLLQDEMNLGIHALAQRMLTPSELGE